VSQNSNSLIVQSEPAATVLWNGW